MTASESTTPRPGSAENSPSPSGREPTAGPGPAPDPRPSTGEGGQENQARPAPAAELAGAGGEPLLAAAAAPSAPEGILGEVRARLAQVRGLWRDFTGESGYERYLERHRREHPDHEPMSEREWWRWKAEYDEEHVEGSCC